MRLHKLKQILEEQGLDLLIVSYEWNVNYYLKLPRASGTFIIVESKSTPKVLTPALDLWRVLYHVKSEAEVLPYASYELPGLDVKLITGKLSDWIVNYLKASKARRVGLDLSYVTSLNHELHMRLANVMEVVDVGPSIAAQRSIKEPEEIEYIKKALSIAETAFVRVIENGILGKSEAEVSALIDSNMRLRGAEGIAFDTIVASGPNSAYPHAYPTDRVLTEGDLVVVDFGARVKSYCSDTTRSLRIGRVEPEIIKALEAVKEALLESTELIREGVQTNEPDSKARDVLRKYGLEKYFIHSLGHGIGVEVHEKPRLAQGSQDVLVEGMVVTVEPGVYIPGKYGVRLENLVLVKKSGYEVLNKLPLIF